MFLDSCQGLGIYIVYINILLHHHTLVLHVPVILVLHPMIKSVSIFVENISIIYHLCLLVSSPSFAFFDDLNAGLFILLFFLHWSVPFFFIWYSFLNSCHLLNNCYCPSLPFPSISSFYFLASPFRYSYFYLLLMISSFPSTFSVLNDIINVNFSSIFYNCSP